MLTVTVADPTFPAAEALIVAVPALSPLTSPVALTLAMAGLIDDQANEYPLKGVPFASRAVATSCSVPPAWTDPLAGLIVIEATVASDGAATVIWAEPVFPPAVAVTVAVPPATPVTRPVDETDATPEFDDAQVTVCPETGLPSASVTAAASCTFPETAIDAVEGVTETVATVDEDVAETTLATTVSSTPPVIARILASPTATPFTTPPETVATAVFIDNHSTGAPGIGLPAASYAVAVSVVDPPTVTDGLSGEIWIDAAPPCMTPLCGLWPSGPVRSPGNL